MKKVKLIIQESSISEIVGREFELTLSEKANIIDVIHEVDKIIGGKGKFPYPEYHSLLHMTYNPVKERFYEQATVTAYIGSGESLNVRDEPKSILPDGATIILGLGAGCGDFEWEEVMDYDKFREAILRRTQK